MKPSWDGSNGGVNEQNDVEFLGSSCFKKMDGKNEAAKVASVEESSPSARKRQEAEVLHKANQATTLPGDPLLLPGELQCFKLSQVTLLDPFHGSMLGTLHVTNYKVFFREEPEDSEVGSPFTLEIPLGAISSIEKVGKSKKKEKKDALYGLELVCKDMRNVKFTFSQQEEQQRKDIYTKLQILAFPLSHGSKLFAYHFREVYPEDGWKVYEPADDYQRMGVVNDQAVPWRITDKNHNFELCDTYPAVLAVPKSVSDDELSLVATFRSRSRMPVLSWLHNVTYASITRCSQPLVGPRVKRSENDEKYIQAIIQANRHSNKLYIVDARPKINAIANVAMGGGYEHDDNYTNTEFSFLDIGNIHVMRDSLRKVKDMVYPAVDDVHFWSNLESTRWLDHIKTILSGAVRIAELVQKHKSSVLIHCTDGWDRTAQLSALAMLMLDPYYRTIKGLEVLIEKEWLSFGHKFNQRIGHGDRNHSDEQRAPVFVQFIDCVWQMTKQFPCAFEFNELFLITILDHLYTCLFGTFLCNSEKARVDTKVKDETVSLWSFTNSQIDLYRNPLFSDKTTQPVLYPLSGIRHLSFWTGYYIRWNPRMQPQEVEIERQHQLQFLIAQLKDRYELLLKEVTQSGASDSSGQVKQQ